MDIPQLDTDTYGRCTRQGSSIRGTPHAGPHADTHGRSTPAPFDNYQKITSVMTAHTHPRTCATYCSGGTRTILGGGVGGGCGLDGSEGLAGSSEGAGTASSPFELMAPTDRTNHLSEGQKLKTSPMMMGFSILILFWQHLWSPLASVDDRERGRASEVRANCGVGGQMQPASFNRAACDPCHLTSISHPIASDCIPPHSLHASSAIDKLHVAT